jgi:predicted  nucleic acid-binding Zn-ribbon protein
MKKNEKDPSNQEILEAINIFADHTEKRFKNLESDMSSVKSEMSSMKSEMSSVKSDVISIKSEMSSMKSEIKSIKSQMVTKDYLDDKLADLHGDLVVLARKEDKKLLSLVHILKNKKVISEADTKMIFAMEPFGQ